MIISSTLLIALVVYCSCKEINVIAHTSLILTFLNLINFILSNSSLIGEVNLDYLFPILKTPTTNIITSSIKIAIINTLPIISILIIPKNNITNKKKYNKSIIITYVVGCIISFIITILTISILGIYLVKTFEYSEYISLKKIKLFGFLERIENITSMQWITSSFVYLTLIVYSISKNINKNKTNEENELNYHKTNKIKKKFIYTNIIIGILIIISTHYFFPSITYFNNYISRIFIYLVSILIPIYLIIIIKIFQKK